MLDHGLNIIGVWNQTNVYWSTTSGLDGLAVVARKVKSIGFEFDAHRDADAWSCVYLIHRQLPIAIFPMPCSPWALNQLATAIANRQL
jgi:hypothetical protein